MGVDLGFRRRCAWCGVQLRGWQLNLCRKCKTATGSGIGGILSSPPCTQGSRWDRDPDKFGR